MDPNQQDWDWCRKALQGDEAAAERLLDAHYARVYAYHRRQADSDADAADLTQETFRRVWKSLSGFQEGSTVGTWIHRIAYCAWVDWLRQRKPAESVPEPWWQDLPSTQPSPLEAATQAEELRCLWREVAALPDEERQVVHLHFGQHLTQAQAAEVLSMPLSTLKVRLNSALQRLRQRLSHSNPVSP